MVLRAGRGRATRWRRCFSTSVRGRRMPSWSANGRGYAEGAW